MELRYGDLVMVKYKQKKQEIKPRLFDISRFTVFERNFRGKEEK